MISNDVKAKIRQYYYGHKYSKIQLSKRFNIPLPIINSLTNQLDNE